jgi:hypothetical protein
LPAGEEGAASRVLRPRDRKLAPLAPDWCAAAVKILILRNSGVSVASEEAVSPRPISTVDQAAMGSKV